MNKFRLPKFLSYIDFGILFSALALVTIGILSIFSSGVDAEGNRVSTEYMKQLIWAVSGLFLMMFASSIDLGRYKDYSVLIYLLFMLILIYTRIGGKVVNGARSWIGIGDYGIQPSEFAKLATILFLARYLDGSEEESDIKRLMISGLIIVVPVALILLQPDFGTSLVFFPILIFMIYIAGLDTKYIVFILLTIVFTFLLLILPLSEKYLLKRSIPALFMLHRQPYNIYLLVALIALAALSAWGWNRYRKRYYFWLSYSGLLASVSLLLSIAAQKVLKEYQIMRLMVFLDPGIDPRGSGWNILQAVTAIGSGGVTGKGYLQGTQSHAKYIPQQGTDFIFSIIAEEWGFLGGLVVFALFCFILFRCVKLLSTVKDRYLSFVVAGIMGMFFFHFLINAGMAMGIMPITGIPLYFLSYGGSSLWAAMIAVGILLGISARRYRM